MKNQFGQNTNKNISALEVYYFKVNTKREYVLFRVLGIYNFDFGMNTIKTCAIKRTWITL